MNIKKAGLLRRILTIGLGVFWLIDGILQLQPAMFTNAFIATVLAPSAQGQPGVISAMVTFGIRLFSANIFWSNFTSAFLQLLIGALLVFPFSDAIQRFALWLSVGWALIIWIFGEGLGGMFTGSATFYTGAPGSVLFYLILALALLYSFERKLPLIAGIAFLLGALLNLTPMFWQSGMLSMLSMMPSIAGPLGALGPQWTMVGNLIAVDVLACLGIFLILVPNRWMAWMAIVFLVVVWIFGQGFGGLQTFPTGTTTDPNSAPLLILFLIPIFFIEKRPVKP